MSQTRAHARRHVIANWRGLAFHCFDIDRHLTGLQGQNGSGKTTVMAAYVTAILPNQRLLNFPNITAGGASGKTDAGLWGRLGDDGVSYTLIEWVTPKGKNIWAGVAMTRHNMPTIEMKTFTVEDLPEVVDPYDAFLIKEGTHTTVPQLGRLRDHLTMLGARVTTHRSVSDYLRTLYENGITPLPMSTHEEQERFYRILATSMAGSSLGSLARAGLRDYLLTEDSSLERRVSNMRESLEHCRQTKRELERAQDSHAEINGIYESAWEMSSCAFFGALARYEQANESWRTQLKITRETRREHATQKNALKRLSETVVELEKKLAQAQALVTEKTGECHHKTEARQIRINLEKARSDHHIAQAKYDRSTLKRDEALKHEVLAEAQYQKAQDDCIRISDEMGNLQKAAETLIQRVAALKVAREKLAAAKKAIPDQNIDPHTALVIKKKLDDEYDELTAGETRAQSELDSVKEHQKNFEQLLDEIRKLSQIEGGPPVNAENAHSYGLQLDAMQRDKTARSQQIDRLLSALAKTNDLASKQQQVQREAHALGIDSSQTLVDTISSIDTDIARLESEDSSRKNDLQEKRQALSQVDSRLPSLEDANRRYSEAESYRQQLRELESEMASIDSVNEFETAQAAARERATTLHNHRIAIEDSILQTEDSIRNLRSQSGAMHPLIGSIAEQLEGHLFAAHFDELSTEEAAITQARIGIWTEAIVVESPQHAAQRASEMENRPDTLLFMSERAAVLQQTSLTVGDSELVKENTEDSSERFRLTRRPDRPVLGRRAREAEIARLGDELNTLKQSLAQLREECRKTQCH